MTAFFNLHKHIYQFTHLQMGFGGGGGVYDRLGLMVNCIYCGKWIPTHIDFRLLWLFNANVDPVHLHVPSPRKKIHNTNSFSLNRTLMWIKISNCNSRNSRIFVFQNVMWFSGNAEPLKSRNNDTFMYMNIVHLVRTSSLLLGCVYWSTCHCQRTHLRNRPHNGFLCLALGGWLVTAWFFFRTSLLPAAIRFHVWHAVYFPPRRRTTAFRRRVEWGWSRWRGARALRSRNEVVIWLTVVCRCSFRRRFQVGVPFL
jgi:hypothetical protein